VPAVTSGGKSKASAKARSFRVIEGEQDFINCVDGAGLLDGLLGREMLSVCIKRIFQDRMTIFLKTFRTITHLKASVFLPILYFYSL